MGVMRKLASEIIMKTEQKKQSRKSKSQKADDPNECSGGDLQPHHIIWTGAQIKILPKLHPQFRTS